MQRSQAYWGFEQCLDDPSTHVPTTRHFYPHYIFTQCRSAVTIPPCDILKLYNASSIFLPQLVRGGRLVTCDMISTLVFLPCDIMSNLLKQNVDVLTHDLWTHL
jgi:hypothetical protein